MCKSGTIIQSEIGMTFTIIINRVKLSGVRINQSAEIESFLSNTENLATKQIDDGYPTYEIVDIESIATQRKW